MGIVAIITKIMPESVDSDLNSIKESAKDLMEKEGAKNISFEEKPIAFGLKGIFMKMAWPEEKESSIVEEKLLTIAHVSSVNIEDYRRAFG